jgi:hypothetical protein
VSTNIAGVAAARAASTVDVGSITWSMPATPAVASCRHTARQLPSA